MPLYEFKCEVCNRITTDLRDVEERNDTGICKACGGTTKHIVSRCNLITDTNFGWTGKVDARLGDRPIDGRADWKKRLAEQGLIETDKNFGEKTTTMEDRVKKFSVMG